MNNSTPARLSLFEAIGVELEYILVDSDTLDVRPASDELLRAMTGAYQSDVERDGFCWSNELVLHVVEIKTNGPAASLEGLAAGFQREVLEINRRLAPLGCRLMPTGMHPWMDPRTETRLWPHEYSSVYRAYDRIFGCQGHGWSNLQSTHLNLPFADDWQFGALHAAIRALLPLLPAIAASSPVADGKAPGWVDHRLAVYRTNSARIPSLTGRVIPEPVFTQADYQRVIFDRIYDDIAPFDPEGVLRDEFLNSRGAIARFGRGSIEIRVLDSQECPAADLAITSLIRACLHSLVNERWVDLERLKALDTLQLEAMFLETAKNGELAMLADTDCLAAYGWRGCGQPAARDIWEHLVREHEGDLTEPVQRSLQVMMEQGPLARRILRALDRDVSPGSLRGVYGTLCACLAAGEMFVV